MRDVLGITKLEQIKGLTIDRIDNDGHYEPGNIQFISHKLNCNNKLKETRCINNSCPLRDNCYTFLKTSYFKENQECFHPKKDGTCEWFIECKTKKDFNNLENK